ncbi:hypothetical protein LCGC14_0396690 [marine sediment metagenome]|uniref:Large polyvalent protein associated domain-containing protein n=1 Tax=marine sediment metagenome TaxID=412755 RepID=A0A0F9TG65_9ZZZZ
MTLPPDLKTPPITWGGQIKPQPMVKPAPMIKPSPFEVPQIGLPQITPTVLPEEHIELPWWQRALQVFATPFVWVDENIIQPGLAISGVTIGFVDEVERDAGEDYWEWKKRSWAGWDAPGFNLNVPWSDEPWRVDLKGVMEIAPWLLIPAVGQVGTAVSGLGKVGLRASGQALKSAVTAGQTGEATRIAAGMVISYSPWGLAEKAVGVTAGKAIKGGFKSIGFISERVGKSVSEKLFGKIPDPPPPTIAETKLTKYWKEAVMPAYGKVHRLIPEQLRPEQRAVIEKHRAIFGEGKISHQEWRRRVDKDLAKLGGVKDEFALTPEALASRQAKEIAKIEANVVSGVASKELGDKLISKIKKSPEFTAVPFRKAEMAEFMAKINKAEQDGYVALGSVNELNDLLVLGLIPEPRFLEQWASIFGKEFAEATGKFINLKPSIRAKIIDGLNLPRAVLATLDLSATFRQGLILGLVRPKDVPRAFIRQLKYFGSEKLSLQMDDMLRSRPLYREGIKAGIEFQAVRRGALSRMKEEPFFSNLAQNIPFVRRSERAFTGYLNEMRMTAFEAGYGVLQAQAVGSVGLTKLLPEHLKLFGDFINFASGRGTLPFNTTQYAPLLNAVLFSPRYQMSTLGLPKILGRMLLSKNPYIRKQAALALATFAGGGAGLLGLLNTTGIAKVEGDPRAGDFGKIRFRTGEDAQGNPIYSETRFDPWRGYIQYARFAAQMLMGERKSAFGNINKAERWDIALRFAQTKFSPAAGLIADLWKGENYLGEPIFEKTTGFIKVAKDRLLPLAVQDVMDAIEMQGANGIWVAAPASLGIGVLTFVNDLNRIQQKIARDMGYEGWDAIDPKTRREIEMTNTELQVATIAFDRQTMGFAWSDWHQAGKAIDNVFRQNVELAVAEYRKTDDGYKFKEKVSDAFTAKRGGYQAREAELRFEDIVKRLNIQDTVESDLVLGPEAMAIRIYNDALWGEDMYDEFGNYKYSKADIRKEQLLRDLGQEMFTYAEEYRGLKYEDFPPEFQQLKEAQTILEPYWEVKEEADKYFGLQDSPRKDAFILRRRKAIKRGNPMIGFYLDIFYKRS